MGRGSMFPSVEHKERCSSNLEQNKQAQNNQSQHSCSYWCAITVQQENQLPSNKEMPTCCSLSRNSRDGELM